MLDIIRDWYSRNFSDPQAVILALLLLVVFGLLWLVGDILAPVLFALVLAYLLEGVVATMQNWRVPRTAASRGRSINDYLDITDRFIWTGTGTVSAAHRAGSGSTRHDPEHSGAASASAREIP